MCHCKCGLCNIKLGKKIPIPSNLQSPLPFIGFESKNNNCYLLYKNSINTSHESNLKILNRGDGIYLIICRICKDSFLIQFPTKTNEQNNIHSLALIPKSWMHPMSPDISGKPPIVQKNEQIPAIEMTDLFKFDGIETSPVIIRQQSAPQLKPLQPLEEYDDHVEDQLEIVHDCIFGSFYESPLYMDQILFA